MKSHYKAILIDLDNTLANTEDFYEGAVKEVFKLLKPRLRIVSWSQFKYSYDLAREMVHSNLANTAASHSRAMYIQYTLEILGAIHDADIIYKAEEVYWKYVLKNASLYPGAKNFLKYANNAGIKIVIITDNTLQIQLRKLAALNISSYIDAVVTSEEAGADKPAINQFLLGMHKVHSTIYDTIVIGNNPQRDIKGAQNANLPSCLFDYNGIYSDISDQFECYVNSYRKLIKYLDLKSTITLGNNNTKFIIMDLMGTVFIPCSLIKKVLYPLLKENGIHLPYKYVYDAYSKLSAGLIKEKDFWINIKVRSEQVDKIIREFLKRWRINRKLIKILKDIGSSKNIKFVLFSNVPSPWGYTQLAKFKLDDLFYKIFFADLVGVRKPNLIIYDRLLKELQPVLYKNIYFLDDKLSSLRAAKFFNATTIWYSEYADLSKPVVHIPNFHVKNIEDIKNIIN